MSVFHGGSKKKPAFTVSCNAKAMIHGHLKSGSGQRATLLVYEFKFNSYRGTRIKEADVLFEFHSRNGRSAGPTVAAVRPNGIHKMEETTQNESSKFAVELKAGPQIPAVDAGVTLSKEDAVEKITKHHTVVRGDNPQSDDWGNYFQARFFLSENKSQSTGIPSQLTVCILLEREDDEDFECRPYIEATPNFTTMIASLGSSRAPDEPIIFDVRQLPFDSLESDVNIDPDNLAAVDLEELWGCTMYSNYGKAIK